MNESLAAIAEVIMDQPVSCVTHSSFPTQGYQSLWRHYTISLKSTRRHCLPT